MKHLKLYGLCVLFAVCAVTAGCKSVHEYRSSQIKSETPQIGDQNTKTETRETESRVIKEKPVIGEKKHSGAGEGAGWVE